MAWQPSNYTAEKRQKWLNEGRGQGTGSAYKPWLTYHDVPSTHSHKSRAPEGKHGRTCHLMSLIERDCFFYCDAARYTQNIYDQFRLDLDETREIAKLLHIPHPHVRETNEDWDMTTDLVVEQETEGGLKLIPISCKPESGLKIFNNIEHAEIERVYWERRGCKLTFCTESANCISNAAKKNLAAMKPHRLVNEHSTYPGYYYRMLQIMKCALNNQNVDCTVGEFCKQIETSNSLQPGDGLHLALHFIYRNAIVGRVGGIELRKQSILSVKELTELHSIDYVFRSNLPQESTGEKS